MVTVTAGIELGIAMEAAVSEICGQIFRVRPFAGGISKNERDIKLAQELEKIREQKTDVPNFYAITQGPITLYFQPGALLYLRVMPATEKRGFFRCFWQQLKKLPETFLVP